MDWHFVQVICLDNPEVQKYRETIANAFLIVQMQVDHL